ncbi:hypothetical protein [methanotrophic endosymbiont of Bathymodiolus puteoserpentis (Logatchev)]|jgi:hypothetical protein|uniref:hypothetical protein n=1 Tax=methanotrophic endosymbiont of Bathymodiolus puteoserpentis (Logatchev) TaxID=343235 RepID=UPI00157A5C07|nr:hypothetical protein [methanotrophic endosymbiont of Bathymodiolus puteoserpentis (Logatchev)]
MKKILLLCCFLASYASNAFAWSSGGYPPPYFSSEDCWLGGGDYTAENGVVVTYDGADTLNVGGSNYTMTGISCYLSEGWDLNGNLTDVDVMNFSVDINGTIYFVVIDSLGELYY